MDAVQIVGRFRNGVSNIYHVTNYDYRIPMKSKEYIWSEYYAAEVVYNCLGTFADTVPTEVQREAFRNAQQVVPYNIYLDENGKVNPYKVDNYIDQEILKSTYNNTRNIQVSYEECGYFNVMHSYKSYKFGDYERLKIESKTASIKKKRKEIVAQLEQLGVCETEAEQQYKRDLEFADPLIVEAYDLLGKEEIERLKYSVTKMRVAIILKKHKLKARATDAIKLINAYFHPQQWYSAKTIKDNIKKVFTLLNIPHHKAITSHTINAYFEAEERRTHNGRGYYLIAPKFL